MDTIEQRYKKIQASVIDQETRNVTYYSDTWKVLVETGWYTRCVYNGVALMVKKPTK